MLFQQYHWLQRLFDGQRGGHGGGGGGGGHGGTAKSHLHDGTPLEDKDLSEDEIEDLLGGLREKREAWAHTGPEVKGSESFKVSLLGGKWLAKTKGLACDAFRGGVKARSEAEEWCGLYSL